MKQRNLYLNLNNVPLSFKPVRILVGLAFLLASSQGGIASDLKEKEEEALYKQGLVHRDAGDFEKAIDVL